MSAPPHAQAEEKGCDVHASLALDCGMPVLLAAALPAGARATARELPPAQGARGGTVVLVSLDGFRWDYLDLGLTPNLYRLAREGVRAEAMVPVFPTKTFPNHYSIVTGRYPARHGILGNVFTDPELGRSFSPVGHASRCATARFYLAEPIWVTAERQGRPDRPSVLAGERGADQRRARRPTPLPFDGAMPDTAPSPPAARLARPAGRGSAAEVPDALLQRRGQRGTRLRPRRRGDQARDRAGGQRCRLSARPGWRAAKRRTPMNLVIVSDHGMASTGPDRVVWLDDYVAADALRADEMSALLTAWPADGLEDSVYRGLKRAPHLTTYRRAELPARFHLEGSPRVAPSWRSRMGLDHRLAGDRRPAHEIMLGESRLRRHTLSMRSIFIAHGPGFRRGVTVPPFRNIHVYPLLAEVLGSGRRRERARWIRYGRCWLARAGGASGGVGPEHHCHPERSEGSCLVMVRTGRRQDPSLRSG